MIHQTELDNLSLNHGDCSVSVGGMLWSPEGCNDCSDYLLEAWERMTTGGVGGSTINTGGRRFVAADGYSTKHIQWHYAAR